MSIEEYLVTDIFKLELYIDENIGVDYESTFDDGIQSGSVTVFDLNNHEHNMIRQFIDDEGLWLC